MTWRANDIRYDEWLKKEPPVRIVPMRAKMKHK